MTFSSTAAEARPVTHGVRVSELSLVFKGHRPLFQPISFEAGPGRAIVLTGLNGVGKSTLLAHLADTVSGRASEVQKVAGTVEFDASQRVWHIISGHLFSGMTVEEHLRLVALGFGVSGLGSGLDDWGLTKLKDRVVENLSGGERQRVELAMTWVSGAGIVLIDEPLRGLDPAGCKIFGQSLRHLLCNRRTVIVAEHRLRTLRDSVGIGLDLQEVNLIAASERKA